MIELGKTYTDSVSGFKGVATSLHTYLNGCTRVALQGKVNPKDGKVPDAEMFDTQQIAEEMKLVEVKATATGGDRKAPPMRKQLPLEKPLKLR